VARRCNVKGVSSVAYFKGLDLKAVKCSCSFQLVTELRPGACVLKQKFPVNVVLFAGRSVFKSSIPLPSVW